MSAHDESQQSAELRQSFLRHFPKRADVLQRRGVKLCSAGWDINALNLLYQEIQALAGASGKYGLVDASEVLFAIEVYLSSFVERVAIPSAAQTAEIRTLFDKLSPFADEVRELPVESATESVHDAHGAAVIALQVVPPADFWRKHSEVEVVSLFERPREPEPVVDVAAAAAEPAPASRAPERPDLLDSTRWIETVEPIAQTSFAGTEQVDDYAFGPVSEMVSPEQLASMGEAQVESEAEYVPDLRPAPSTGRKIYHLANDSDFAGDLDAKLGRAGFLVERFADAGDFKEMLGAYTPDLVLIDASYFGFLDEIGQVIAKVRERTHKRLAMVALAENTEITVRLKAMRAGADAFFAMPVSVGEVVTRISELLAAEQGEPYRVLIVEDDRSQAMFAESILRKAGVQARIEMDPLAALKALDEFKPDLILVDLYMPQCDGMELTAIIRERPAFVSTPIVFLSGEHDTDKRFEALSAGGDDFLAKPIRPKHLISAVTNRLRRSRVATQRGASSDPRDPVTGLYYRTYVIEHLNQAMAEEQGSIKGGILFVEVDGLQYVRERAGSVTALNALLHQLGAMLVQLAQRPPVSIVSRFGDGSFVVFDERADEKSLLEMAQEVRRRVGKQVFEVAGRSHMLSISIGVCCLDASFADAAGVVNAAESACNEARQTAGQHVRIYHAKGGSRRADEQEIAEHLRQALEHDGLQLVFQPIVAVDGAAGEMFQVLLRLAGQGGRVYTASQIVPVAEREKLIGDVDRWVLARALMVLEERRRQDRPLSLFVNQSAASVQEMSRIGWLKQLLETREISGGALTIEFKLNDVLAHLRGTVGFCIAARQLGIRISLGAFEASPTAFQLLQYLPLDYIKVAPKYLAMAQSPALKDEFERLVEQAHARGKKVIAPQIEDARSAAALWTTGIDYIQGNFLQQPAQEMAFDFQAEAG